MTSGSLIPDSLRSRKLKLIPWTPSIVHLWKQYTMLTKAVSCFQRPHKMNIRLNSNSAGVTMKDMAGSRTSVHVGCFGTDYQSTQCRDQQNIAKYSATGSSGCILSNRISWFFDLIGPSMTIDTACSSSMVAFDLACKGLWDGSVDSVSTQFEQVFVTTCLSNESLPNLKAIVGGANLIQSPDLSIMLSNMSFLSPDGRCYSFDHRGNGYARGEGVAALILKPLSHAVRDKNPIRALVRAVGTNQDGYTKGGLTQPSMRMQAALIKETYRRSGLSMGETRLFEAHGINTRLRKRASTE